MNVGISVSRVGSAAQIKAMKQVAGEELPLNADSSNGGTATINVALNDLGLVSTRARLCFRAAGELEKKQNTKNEGKIDKDKVQSNIDALKDYQAAFEIHNVGYYDAFELHKDSRDFQANVKRLVLEGVWDEIIEMLKRYELPD